MPDTGRSAYKNYIGGQWVESVSGRTYPVFNPAKKTESVGEFQTSNNDDAAAAVAAAKEGLAAWANTPAPGRAATRWPGTSSLERRRPEPRTATSMPATRAG